MFMFIVARCSIYTFSCITIHVFSVYRKHFVYSIICIYLCLPDNASLFVKPTIIDKGEKGALTYVKHHLEQNIYMS